MGEIDFGLFPSCSLERDGFKKNLRRVKSHPILSKNPARVKNDEMIGTEQ